MTISILTLFPQMFAGPFDFSIIKRAQAKNLVTINFVNIRDFATDNYGSVDDHPYGGGVGMVMRVDILDRALEATKEKYGKNAYTILLDPKGTRYTQKIAQSLTHHKHLILVCGHYEGVDHRVTQLVDSSISVGDYVLTGGEIPTMTIVDSVVRLIPGVLEKSHATVTESFTQNSLEAPQYTRPREYKGMSVPEVLLSGDPKKIAAWQKEHSLSTETD